jgi:hypothetical protein
MKLVTWNCQGAYRKKATLIAHFKPDIAVIQECETLDRLTFAQDIPRPTAQVWFGNSIHKNEPNFRAWLNQVCSMIGPSIRSILRFVVIFVRSGTTF